MSQTRTIEVSFDVYDLVNEFLELGSDDQARFFNLIADRFAEWRYSDSDMQLCDIGKRLMESEDGEKGADFLKRLTAFATPEPSKAEEKP